jgi:hypothetical protein
MALLLPALAALALSAGEPLPSPQAAEAPEPAPAASRAPARLASLVGGASLGAGGAAWSAVAGYPLLAVAYGQGFTDRDDWSVVLDVDWAATEAVPAGGWRREILRSEATHLALRFGLGFYACAGGTWIWADNRADVGLQLTGGLAFSADAGPGLFTIAGDVPVTWTFQRGGGWILAPLATLAYEAPVLEDFSVGARLGAGVRAAGGGAPGANASRTLLEFLLVATWRVF